MSSITMLARQFQLSLWNSRILPERTEQACSGSHYLLASNPKLCTGLPSARAHCPWASRTSSDYQPPQARAYLPCDASGLKSSPRAPLMEHWQGCTSGTDHFLACNNGLPALALIVFRRLEVWVAVGAPREAEAVQAQRLALPQLLPAAPCLHQGIALLSTAQLDGPLSQLNRLSA